MGTATPRPKSLNVTAAAAGVVLSAGALAALVYQGVTYGGHGATQIPIPAMLALAALCTGMALLIATAFARTRT